MWRKPKTSPGSKSTPIGNFRLGQPGFSIEQVEPEAFCEDERVGNLIDNFAQAVKNQDGEALANWLAGAGFDDTARLVGINRREQTLKRSRIYFSAPRISIGEWRMAAACPW
jgi:hypothetical protein